MYPTQDTLRMETASVKQEEKTGKRIIVKHLEGRNMVTIKVKIPKQGVTIAEDQTMQLIGA